MVVYEDSAPENWRERLDDLHLCWIEGPLHDNDINADGEPKKPHYHIILTYPSLVSFEAVKEITDEVLRNVECSGDRSGYLIYQGDKKLMLL